MSAGVTASDVSGGHELESGDMMAYRYHADDDVSISIHEGHTTDIQAGVTMAKAKWMEAFGLVRTDADETETFDVVGDTVTVTALDGDAIEVTRVVNGEVRDEFTLSADDIEQVKDTIREARNHLEYEGLV